MQPTTRFRACATAFAVLLTTAGWSADATESASASAAVEASATSSSAAIDPVLDERVTSILDEFADPDNAQLKTPGADLYRLPTAALPLLINALNLRDLPWAERAALHRAREHLEAQLQGHEISAAWQHRVDYYNAQMVEAYDRVGVRDPAWDAPVEQALRLIATKWGQDPRRTGDELERAVPLLDRAAAARCTDPYVRFLRVHLRELGVDQDYHGIGEQEFLAAQAILATGYPPWVKVCVLQHTCNLILNQWNGHPAGRQLDLLKTWMAAQPQLLTDTATDPHIFIEMSYNLDVQWLDQMTRWTGDRGAAFATLDALLRPALPDHPLPLLVEANYDQEWAWEARGGGYADTVTDEGWRLMAERMAKNKAAIARAWQLDPHCSLVPLVAMNSANGNNLGKDEVLRWLNRSQTIPPGDADIPNAYLYYLEPKWHGSTEEMLQFGRQCLATGDWDNELPDTLVNARVGMSRYTSGQDSGQAEYEYLKKPEVWADIQAVYEGLLAVRPHDVEHATDYFWYAYHCGKTDIARRLAQSLGDHPWFFYNFNHAIYAKMRADLGLAPTAPGATTSAPAVPSGSDMP